MRSLTTAEQAAISSYALPVAMLLEMDLDTPLFMNSSGLDLELNGVEYLGSRGLGQIEAVRDTAGEYTQLKFTLSGVPPTHIALADATETSGREVRVKVAIFDPATVQVISTRTRFVGRLQPLIITDTPKGTIIEATAESYAASLMRPVNSLFSDAEQQRLYPGDLFFQYVSDQAEMRVVWPAASWGRQ